MICLILIDIECLNGSDEINIEIYISAITKLISVLSCKAFLLRIFDSTSCIDPRSYLDSKVLGNRCELQDVNVNVIDDIRNRLKKVHKYKKEEGISVGNNKNSTLLVGLCQILQELQNCNLNSLNCTECRPQVFVLSFAPTCTSISYYIKEDGDNSFYAKSLTKLVQDTNVSHLFWIANEFITFTTGKDNPLRNIKQSEIQIDTLLFSHYLGPLSYMLASSSNESKLVKGTISFAGKEKEGFILDTINVEIKPIFSSFNISTNYAIKIVSFIYNDFKEMLKHSNQFEKSLIRCSSSVAFSSLFLNLCTNNLSLCGKLYIIGEEEKSDHVFCIISPLNLSSGVLRILRSTSAFNSSSFCLKEPTPLLPEFSEQSSIFSKSFCFRNLSELSRKNFCSPLESNIGFSPFGSPLSLLDEAFFEKLSFPLHPFNQLLEKIQNSKNKNSVLNSSSTKKLEEKLNKLYISMKSPSNTNEVIVSNTPSVLGKNEDQKYLQKKIMDSLKSNYDNFLISSELNCDAFVTQLLGGTKEQLEGLGLSKQKIDKLINTFLKSQIIIDFANIQKSEDKVFKIRETKIQILARLEIFSSRKIKKNKETNVKIKDPIADDEFDCLIKFLGKLFLLVDSDTNSLQSSFSYFLKQSISELYNAALPLTIKNIYSHFEIKRDDEIDDDDDKEAENEEDIKISKQERNANEKTNSFKNSRLSSSLEKKMELSLKREFFHSSTSKKDRLKPTTLVTALSLDSSLSMLASKKEEIKANKHEKKNSYMEKTIASNATNMNKKNFARNHNLVSTVLQKNPSKPFHLVTLKKPSKVSKKRRLDTFEKENKMSLVSSDQNLYPQPLKRRKSEPIPINRSLQGKFISSNVETPLPVKSKSARIFQTISETPLKENYFPFSTRTSTSSSIQMKVKETPLISHSRSSIEDFAVENTPVKVSGIKAKSHKKLFPSPFTKK